MEPMAVSTPSSPTTPPVTNPNYLPAYLMGQSNQNSPLTTTHSPDRPNHPGLSFGHSNSKLFNPLPAEPYFNTPPSTSSNLNTSRATELNIVKSGPPKQGLFDSLYVPDKPNTSSFYIQPQEVASPPVTPYGNRSVQPNQFNESFGINENVCDTTNCWVTVFGFPSNASSIVLGRFLDCGMIAEKRSPTQGNWMHLKFSTPQEAGKALAFNGKVIANAIMVGVVPYNSRQENKENTSTVSVNFTSPIRARPLRRSFTSPGNNSSFVANRNTPQKSTGLVTKAMEFVFGW